MQKIISTKEASGIKDLQIITYFRQKKASDLGIQPMKGVRIGTKENPRTVDCDLNLKARRYDHFEWLECLRKELKDDGIKSYIVENSKGARALGRVIIKPKQYLQGYNGTKTA